MVDIDHLESLIEHALTGGKRPIGRLISMVEDYEEASAEISKRLFSRLGNAYVIGITGPPGSGKSTLTDKLVKLMRTKAFRVAVIAVDPSSPFSHGAILGDRIRMNDLALDPDVFIRSMGTRGRLGGLAPAVEGAVKIFDACGFDYIIIETVGVGQSEVDIAQMADTTVVVSVPGLGDDIQMIKAGILEIGDILAINKSDLDGAAHLASMLQTMLFLSDSRKEREWTPPIVMVTAAQNKGVDDLYDAIKTHRDKMAENNMREQTRKIRLGAEIESLLKNRISTRIFSHYHLDELLNERMDAIANRELNPYEWADEQIDSIFSNFPSAAPQ
jgi:LAO/AO transport system kinase